MFSVLDDELIQEDFQKACRLATRSRHLHANWYRQVYPDVEALGMEPVEHYLRYGAALGRNPGKHFDTRFYIQTYPEVTERGQNPLLHYVREGQAKGYATCPPDPVHSAEARVRDVRDKLLGLGLTERALQELEALAGADDNTRVRALAARELASWYMRQRDGVSCRRALDWLAAARQDAPDIGFRRRLAISELLCHHFLGDEKAGSASYERVARAGEMTPDAFLAWVNFQTTVEARCLWMNQVLAAYRLSPIGLLAEDMAEGTSTAYDRLTSGRDLPAVEDGPKVTVLMAAYDAAAVIGTALRSLLAQTWRNLEILVIDDCSPDDGATCAAVERFAAADPRVRLIRMEENGGAYVARNRGLDEATGEFVTIHDADDWSHPSKIEVQVRHLQENPDVMGCTSEQARATEDLRFTKVRGNGAFIIFNTSSFLWRREPVREALGYWDTVRFGADNEFIRRMQVAFGKDSFAKLRTGPLSFQRESDASITTSPVMGVDGFYYGVRKEYYDAHIHYHANGAGLKYSGDPADRPFPVPPMMRPDRARLLKAPRHFELVIYGDFRAFTPDLAELLEELAQLRAEGRRVGLIESHAYEAEIEGGHAMCEDARAVVDGEAVQVLVYGDEVTTREVRRLPGAGEGGRYMPVVHEQKGGNAS